MKRLLIVGLLLSCQLSYASSQHDYAKAKQEVACIAGCCIGLSGSVILGTSYNDLTCALAGAALIVAGSVIMAKSIRERKYALVKKEYKRLELMQSYDIENQR